MSASQPQPNAPQPNAHARGNVSGWAIEHPVPILLFFFILVVLGLMSYRQLGINDNPNVDFPFIVVAVGEPGASPAEMETQITRKVEDALVGLPNLDHIISTVTEGSSATTVEFAIGADSSQALNDVRDAITRIRQTLPGDITEPQITHPNFSGSPFITYTVSSPTRSVAELSRLVDEDITRSLLTVTGAAQVSRSGGVEREVHVNLDPARLQALGTTVDYVNAQVRALNINLPGGRATAGGQEQSIRTLGSAKSVADLAAYPIGLPNGRSVRLDALGQVSDTFAETRQMAFLDGKPVVAFSVIRSQGAPIVQTDLAVRAQVAELQKTLPPDVTITFVRSMARFTDSAFHASLDALFGGALLAVIVIFIFLRNWQSTVISALAIPLSLIGTFLVMRMIGYSLNGMTMLALTLVVGILVDDAIVDLENIVRHIGMGKSPMQAAFEATDEIGLAIVATTFTIVAVFVPVAFISGIPGQFFRSFGITVAVAVLFSLVVARTLTPLMSAYLLPKDVTHREGQERMKDVYERILVNAVRHRNWTLAFAVVIFIGSLLLVPLIPKGFVSNGDIGEAVVAVNLPAGSTLADTVRVTHAVERLFQGQPGVAKVFSSVGTAISNGFRSSAASVTGGTVNVMLAPRKERSFTLDQFQDKYRPLLATIPGARVAFNQYGATGSSKPVNLILRSNDPAALTRTADEVLLQMRNLPELRDVNSTAAELRPEIEIKPDFSRAAEQGVNVTAIGRVARLATQGESSFNLPKFYDGDQEIPILVQLDPRVRDQLSSIGDLMVPAGTNGLIPLRSVADIAFGSGPVEIDRYDRARQVTLTANLTAGNMGKAVQAAQNLPAVKAMPASVKLDTVGESKIMQEIFASFVFALITGVLFIYAVLVLLFVGFLQPFTILMALPFSIGGAMMALLIGGKELGLYALIGVVMLMGLVTKNSILLVEYTMMSRKHGMGRLEALIEAGRARLRPILMTTIAMIAGMLPIALGLGEGTERLSPMAVAVMGGLITSTLLTLVVVPAAYTVLDDLQHWLWRTIGKPLPDPADAARARALIASAEDHEVTRT